jgi:hypothetical protein
VTATVGPPGLTPASPVLVRLGDPLPPGCWTCSWSYDSRFNALRLKLLGSACREHEGLDAIPWDDRQGGWRAGCLD